MLGIEPRQLRDFIIVPVLKWMATIPYSDDAVKLLLGTAAQESKLGHWIDQTTPGPGPAYGMWQMEKATYKDHCSWMQRYNKTLWKQSLAVNIPTSFIIDGVDELQGNLYLACFFARIHYWRIKESLPTTLEGYARYWKKYYNTSKGSGTEAEFIQNYKELIKPWL